MKLDELLEHCKLSKEQLELECDDKHLVAVSEFIGCWESCAPHFELKPQEIQAIKENNSSHEQRKLIMLRKWKEKKAFKATFGALVVIFLKCGNAQMAQNVCDVLKQEMNDEQKQQREIETNELLPSRQTSNQSNLSYRSQCSKESFRSQHSNLSYRSQCSKESFRSQHSNLSNQSLQSSFGSFDSRDWELKREGSLQQKPIPCISVRDKELGKLCSSLCHFLNKDKHALSSMKAGLVGLGLVDDRYMKAGDVCELLKSLRCYFSNSDISFLQDVIEFSKNEEAVEMVKEYANKLCPKEELIVDEETESVTEQQVSSLKQKPCSSEEKLSSEEKPSGNATFIDEEIPTREVSIATEADQQQSNTHESTVKESPAVQQQSLPESNIDQPTVQIDLEQSILPKCLEGVVKHLVCGLSCGTPLPGEPSVPIVKQPSIDSTPYYTEPSPELVELTTTVKSESITRDVYQCVKSAVASTICLDEVVMFLSRFTKSSILIHWHVPRKFVSHIESAHVQISAENEKRLKELHVSNIVLGGKCVYLNPVYYFSEDVRDSVGPIRVQYIATDEEFDMAVDEAGDRPIVMEFITQKYPATKHLAPHFAKLSMEHSNTLFLLVDRDLCEDTANYFRVEEVPAFHFMKSQYIFPKLQLSGPRVSTEILDMSVQEIAAQPLGDRDPDSYVNLNYLIGERSSECFNTDTPLTDILTKNKSKIMESYYDSDDEEEDEDNGKLLLNFSFPEAMKLHSIQILGPPGGKAPRDVQLFVNQNIKSLDDIRSPGRPFEALRLSEENTTESEGNKPITLPSLPRFSNVKNLTVYVTSNQGGLSSTVVSYVGIFGKPKEGIGAREIGLVDFSKFVACEEYKCPRHDK